jgi:hypothetical protein
MNSFLNIKENDEHALALLLTCLAFQGLGEFELFHSNTHVWLMLSSLNACLITSRVSITLFMRFV